MNNMRLTTGNHTFEKYTDEVNIQSFSGVELDPAWTYEDDEGHWHYARGSEYPTIEWYVDSVEWCSDCNEDHEGGHWVCPLCLETIKKGTRPEKGWVHGLIHYKIDGVEVDEDEWHRAYERYAP
jgi:hypothetical protein